jgi:hypothetical protein
VDPLHASQAPIESLTVAQRLNRFYTAQEQAEEREAEAARYQREAAIEAFSQAREQRQRIERYMRGYTTEEMTAWRTEQQQIREAKIAELERELGRLKGLPDPDLPVQRSANPWREEPVESLLERAKAAGDDPYMKRAVERFDLEREAERSRRADAEISRLEQAVNGGTVTRQAEVDRMMAAGFSRDTAELAATPYGQAPGDTGYISR